MTTPQSAPRPTSGLPSLPLMTCAKCASDGLPFMVETILRSNLVRLGVRCARCRHEWEMQVAIETLLPA
jgi:hypothetical protein